MSETIQRRVNFVVEVTCEKSKIENMSREELLGALLGVLQHTANYLTYEGKAWMMGVAKAPNGELMSYNWAVMDSEAFESEDSAPQENMQ
jgi:hypothetical protein